MGQISLSVRPVNMNVRELLEQHQVPIADPGNPHFRNYWVNVQCVFCHSTKFLLGIRNDFSGASCYKCGAKNVVSVLRALTGESVDFIRSLAQFSTVERVEKSYGIYTPPNNLVDLTARDREYLRETRKLDPDILVERYSLRSIGPFSGLARGVFIPITYNRRPVSWQVRFREAVDGQRYKTAKDSEKSMSEKDMLFGAEYCGHTAVVTEGFFDMANIGPGAVCTFGLAYTAKQVLLISRYARRVICFDNSPAAQIVASKLAADLSVFPGETLQVCLDADDPGSASPEEIKLLRKTVGL